MPNPSTFGALLSGITSGYGDEYSSRAEKERQNKVENDRLVAKSIEDQMSSNPDLTDEQHTNLARQALKLRGVKPADIENIVRAGSHFHNAALEHIKQNTPPAPQDQQMAQPAPTPLAGPIPTMQNNAEEGPGVVTDQAPQVTSSIGGGGLPQGLPPLPTLQSEPGNIPAYQPITQGQREDQRQLAQKTALDTAQQNAELTRQSAVATQKKKEQKEFADSVIAQMEAGGAKVDDHTKAELYAGHSLTRPPSGYTKTAGGLLNNETGQIIPGTEPPPKEEKKGSLAEQAENAFYKTIEAKTGHPLTDAERAQAHIQYAQSLAQGKETPDTAAVKAATLALLNERVKKAREEESPDLPEVIAKAWANGIAPRSRKEQDAALVWASKNDFVIPATLSPAAQKILATNEPILDKIHQAQEMLKEFRDNNGKYINTPGYFAVHRLGYAGGVATRLSDIISNLELSKIPASARLLNGATRSLEALHEAQVHFPNVWIGSPAQMERQLANIEDNLNSISKLAVKYGNKSGVTPELPESVTGKKATPGTPLPKQAPSHAVGDIVTGPDGKKYKITSIRGGKAETEEVK